MAKYEALTRHLQSQALDRVAMTFAEIEGVLRTALPRSADTYRAWWSNNPSNNVMTTAWLEAGFETEQVDLPGRKLVFRRVRPSTPDEAPSGFREGAAMQSDFLDAPPPLVPPPRDASLFGWLRGTVTAAPGADLTAPADPDWGANADHA